ncbi:MAG: molecular chaperone HtpG [Planctomycetes bacterium]|nr:molecular chaperone HtpG [Planctomycetota bacterium]
MTPQTETLRFQAEVKELLGLMIHSLYSHREIFLRELVSNASDALDKLRFEALTKPELLSGDERLAIRLEVDASTRTVSIRDNGIGMGHDDLVHNLGTIASSGTRKFLESLRARGATQTPGLPNLIGQFGVGFYSSFMVAAEVVVETRRAGEPHGWRWTSKGDGEFTLAEVDGLERGTKVSLLLKPQGDEDQDFAEPAELAALVRRYSDFVAYPIEMAAAHFKERGDLVKSTAPDGLEVARLNSMQPLWARPKEEIGEREYADFYRHVTHEYADPLETLHFKTDGSNEYTALLFLPSERPFDLFDPSTKKSHVSLYVRRVFVMGECEELVPNWLRFVRGVVDSSDLPVNVSREILQKNRAMGQIKKHVTKKVLAALANLAEHRRADFLRFSAGFGAALKEGVVGEAEEREALAPLLVFATTHADGPTTLPEYVARMQPEQKAIYVLSGEDRDQLARSPQLEAALAKGLEVLLFVEPIDEWVLDRLKDFQGKPLVSLDRGEPDFVDDATKRELQDLEREHRGLCEALERQLGGSISRVRFGARLTESPAVLVDEPHAIGRQMARFLKETGRDVPERKRALELNPEHPVVRKLIELHRDDPASPRVTEFTELLHGQALLAEGSPLSDPSRFSKLVGKLMLGAAH